MAKGAYVGVNGVARKIKKGYVGVDGVARKIKKAYIGIGGVARPCWSGGKLAYYGTVTELSVARRYPAANTTTDGACALFAGGSDSSTGTTPVVDAYNKQLTRTSPEKLSVNRSRLASANVGRFTLFAGGSSLFEDNVVGIVDAYDTSLVRTLATALDAQRNCLAGAPVGNFALFAGGSTSGKLSTSYLTARVDGYNSSLTKVSVSNNLSHAKGYPAGIGNETHAFFAGGTSNFEVGKSEVDVYDKSLTKSGIDSLATGRQNIASAKVGGYVLFAGGATSGSDIVSTVDVYDTSLTHTLASELTYSRYGILSASNGDYAVFAGGRDSVPFVRGWVEVYDKKLTKTLMNNLNQSRYVGGGTTVGDFFLFAGGQIATTVSLTASVEAFTIT